MATLKETIVQGTSGLLSGNGDKWRLCYDTHVGHFYVEHVVDGRNQIIISHLYSPTNTTPLPGMARAQTELQRLKHVCWNAQILSCVNRTLNMALAPTTVDDRSYSKPSSISEWVATAGFDAAIHEVRMFGNQNSVCAPKTLNCRHTVDRLETLFPSWNGASSSGASTFDSEA